MRSRLSLAAGLAVVFVAAIVGLFVARQGDGYRSDTLALALPTATLQPTATATDTPAPTATNTPQPAPTATAEPVPPPASDPPPEDPPHQHPPPQQSTDEWFDTAFANRVLSLLNAERTSRGIAALTRNGALTQSAQNYARTLTRLNALSHNADGTSLQSRAGAAGYPGLRLGEMLWRSVGYLPPEQVVADWMASAGHRDIILDPTFRDAGVGCYFRQTDRLEARCVMDLGA